jgi:ATP-dependent RNA helicase RhlE
MLFQELNIIEPILDALRNEGYTHPTPIQEKAIPHALEGRDVLGCAQTGTGKTAAFSIPVLQFLSQGHHSHRKNGEMRALILTPTRELALQIGESIAAYGKGLHLKHLVVFGGVSQVPQVDALRRGMDVLIATPGRLLDLINQGHIHQNRIEFFVLDEADRMLDMGFIHDVKKVIKLLPEKRQTMFFSATMPSDIQHLADSILRNPVRVEVTPVSSTAEKIEQCHYRVDKNNKRDLLKHVLEDQSIRSALVFSRTKHGADKVARDLNKNGIKAEAIHGDKSQTARVRALEGFKNGKCRVLVATDIAARGIDVELLSHVINFDLPNVPETYVHRIGRTGRAGASGKAISFCDAEEVPYLRDILKLTKAEIPEVTEHPFPTQDTTPLERQTPKPAARRPDYRRNSYRRS